MIVIMMVSTMGFTISKHYCGEDLIDQSISGNTEACCDMQGGCCHDEIQTYQLAIDYTAPVIINHVDYFTIVLFEIPEFLVELQKETKTFASASNFGESPPPKNVLHFLSDIQVYRL